MRSLRAALYPLRLVGARLGRRSAPVVLVVLGIAAGASVVFGVRAGALVAQDRAVAQAIERIPDGQRSVRAVWFGLPALSDERVRRARRAGAGGARGGRRRAADPGRALPRDLRRRDVRGTRRRRGSRPLGDVAQRPPSRDVPPGAVRGAAPARRGPPPAPAGSPARGGRRGGAEEPHPLRRLPHADRQCARRRRGEPGPRACGRVPPAAAAAALPGRGRRRARGGACARLHLPQPRLGGAAPRRCAAALGGRRPRRGCRQGALGPPGRVVRVRPARTRRGAAGGAGDEPGGGPATRCRRRRGRGAPVRVRAARCDDASSRPARGPPQARLVRSARLAARAAHGRRVGCTRPGRYGDRARRRAARGRRRRRAGRRSRGRCAHAQRPLRRGARDSRSSSRRQRRPSWSASSRPGCRARGSGCSMPPRWPRPRSSSSRSCAATATETCRCCCRRWSRSPRPFSSPACCARRSASSSGSRADARSASGSPR